MNHFEHTEILKCADPRSGPAYFLRNYFHIQHPVTGSILLDLHDYQEELIDSYINNTFSINLISRHLGKTAVTAGYLLWEAMFRADRMILVGAHKFNGAIEILQMIRYAYELCPDFLKPACNYFNKTSIKFTNGSQVMAQAITENLGRGMAISTLYLDEFSYAPNSAARAAWSNLSPCFATGCRIIVNSTARRDTDFFNELWLDACHARNKFIPLSIDWHRHPNLSQAWAVDMKGMIGESRFRQEHENEFLT